MRGTSRNIKYNIHTVGCFYCKKKTGFVVICTVKTRFSNTCAPLISDFLDSFLSNLSEKHKLDITSLMRCFAVQYHCTFHSLFVT